MKVYSTCTCSYEKWALFDYSNGHLKRADYRQGQRRSYVNVNRSEYPN